MVASTSGEAPGMTRYVINRHSSDGHGTQSRTTIHRADCVWALRYGAGPKWLGPFATYVEARAAAGTDRLPGQRLRAVPTLAAEKRRVKRSGRNGYPTALRHLQSQLTVSLVVKN